jgi:hypothetical protein
MSIDLFDSKRDREILNRGGFFCIGCLIGKEKETQSKEDPRFCQSCYDFLKEEYKTREFLKDQRKKQDIELNGERSEKRVKKEDASTLISKIGSKNNIVSIDVGDSSTSEGMETITTSNKPPPEGELQRTKGIKRVTRRKQVSNKKR